MSSLVRFIIALFMTSVHTVLSLHPLRVTALCCSTHHDMPALPCAHDTPWAALKYEIRLVESLSSSRGLADVPEHGRTKTCFQIFDELIPQLGVFQHIMKMIRDELCLAMFSSELTSAVNKDGDSSVEEKGAPVYLSRVPYFTIAQKWLNRRFVCNCRHVRTCVLLSNLMSKTRTFSLHLTTQG